MAKLSIIIPTYNCGKKISQCLDSVVSQTFCDFEVLVIDGSSDDDTLSLIRMFNDQRIHIYSHSDLGIYDAMNKGIDKAKGDWLYFLGSDDSLYEPTTLEIVVKHMRPEVDIVYGEVRSAAWDEDFGEWSYGTLRSNRCHQTIFYNRRFFNDGHRYDLRYNIWADHDLNLRWFLLPQFRSQYIPVVIANFGAEGFSANRIDEAFTKVFGWKVLKYGRKTLPVRWKKEYARDIIRHNGEKKILCFLIQSYILVLRVINKMYV